MNGNRLRPPAAPLFLILGPLLLAPLPVASQDTESGPIGALLADDDGDGRPDLLGAAVTVTGVLAEPFSDQRGRRRAHLQDASGGIELSIPSRSGGRGGAPSTETQPDTRDHEAGDLVRVHGQIVGGGRRWFLEVGAMEQLGHVPPPAPQEVLVTDLLEGRHRNMLVRVRGRLEPTPSGPEEARLEDGSGSIPVDVPDELLTDPAFGPRLLEGAEVTLTGFVEWRGGDSPDARASLSLEGQSAFVFKARPPYGPIAVGVVMALLAGALVYMAGRRGIAERRSLAMERMVEQLEATQGTLRKSEGALRDSEAQYRSLIEHAPFGIFRTGPGGTIRFANQALVDMLGYQSASDMIGLGVGNDLFEDREDWRDFEASLASTAHSPARTVRWLHGDGSSLLVRVGIHVVTATADGQRTLEGFVEDVTERQRLEDQLRQSQKMEAVGQLAGGVAHDFNNLLTVILSSSDLLLAVMRDEDDRAEVEEIRAAGARAATLTQQLLAFSRRQPLAPQIVDLNEAVEGSLRLLRRVVGEDVALVPHLDPDVRKVLVDPGQLQQVIMNLVVNARDAMPHGGAITIETRAAVADADADPERYVMLTVKDDGEGMAPETLRRIFEPFFTTKGTGKGTGLGLATVYGIVAQSGGTIRAESRLGEGSSFKVYLPVGEGTSHLEADVAPRPTGGRETVLLVEDDEGVRTLARRVLGRAGYDVLEARDGRAGERLVRTHEGPIHVMVTDVVMPEMSGRELSTHLARRRPGTPVLYISGYSDDMVIRYGVFEEGEAFLRKPFIPDELLRAVRDLLDREGGSVPGLAESAPSVGVAVAE